jgi:hypothetical protein
MMHTPAERSAADVPATAVAPVVAAADVAEVLSPFTVAASEVGMIVEMYDEGLRRRPPDKPHTLHHDTLDCSGSVPSS